MSGGAFERVYTVHDFYDIPRAGFADFGGVPHAYRSVWRDDLDDWDPADRFELSPVSREVLEMALEDWAIWLRWEAAYSAGRVPLESHPALPPDRARDEELAPLLTRAMEIDPARRRVATGEFRRAGGGPAGAGLSRGELQVRWIPVENTLPGPA